MSSNKKRGGNIVKILFILVIAATLVGTAAGGLVFWYFSQQVPKLFSVGDYRPRVVTRIYGKSGVNSKQEVVLGEFYKERRYLIPFDKIPKVVVEAFTSAEDADFFHHQGFNLTAIIRASIANFRAGHVVQGGSTITQQVAKSILQNNERSLVRKIKEVIFASRMESNLSKEQILYLYLNEIYLGHGSYGVEAAALSYFHKPAIRITLAEAAMLAGLPQAPGKYSPLLNPKRAKERQLYVLRRMMENKYITQAQMTTAAAESIPIFDDEDTAAKTGAYLVEHVRRYLVDKFGEKAVYEDGLNVTVPTTPELAKAAQTSLREGLRAVDKRIGYRGPIQKLKTDLEIEKFLKTERLAIIKHRLGYQLFMPDGRIDSFEAMRQAGMDPEYKLLDTEELYRGVVTSIDEKRKSAGVVIGGIRAELPLENMRWARTPGGAEPRTVGAALKRADVIWVKLAKITEAHQVIISLEQEPQVQGAIFSLDAQTGEVLAMEGGYDYEQSEFNRAIQAQRQPGSSYKPIIYAAALEKGFTPASIIVDSPIVYNDAENGKWKPANFEEKFYGDTTFRQALIHSRNVPTIKIVQAITIPYVIDYSKRIGMTAQFNADLSISLGSGALSLFENTRTYALFPRLGRKVSPVFIRTIKDRDGRVLEETKPQSLPSAAYFADKIPHPLAASSPLPDGRIPLQFPTYPLPDDPDQVMDPRVAYVMSHLMNEVVSFGTGHEAKNLGRSAAGKTGTTNDYSDAWFMGFTPHVVTGTWVGFDNVKTIGPGETGAKAALPIWLSFMKEAVKPYPDVEFPVPPGIVFASIDATSGKLAAPNSSQAIRECFIEGTQPTELNTPSNSPPQTQGGFFKEDIE